MGSSFQFICIWSYEPCVNLKWNFLKFNNTLLYNILISGLKYHWTGTWNVQFAYITSITRFYFIQLRNRHSADTQYDIFARFFLTINRNLYKTHHWMSVIFNLKYHHQSRPTKSWYSVLSCHILWRVCTDWFFKEIIHWSLHRIHDPMSCLHDGASNMLLTQTYTCNSIIKHPGRYAIW